MSDTQKKRGRPPAIELPRIPAGVFDPPTHLDDGTELPAKARAYLLALTQTGTATHALKKAGTSWSQLVRWRRQLGEPFRELEAQAMEVALDAVEHAVMRAVLSGQHFPSALAKLALFLLERRRPERYARPETRAKIEHSGRVELAGAPNWIAFLLKATEEDEQGADGGAGGGEAPAGEGRGEESDAS